MIDTVGKYRIRSKDTVWVLTHEYCGIMGTKNFGIDGVFNNLDTALKAKRICEEDKHDWVFYLTEQKLINGIWEDNNGNN